MRRIGTALLWLGGLLLAALMIYTVALDPGQASWRLRGRPATDAAEIAVVFPDREYWDEFRTGIHVCAARELVREVEDGEDAVVVETPTHRRRLRFAFHDVRGLNATREAVHALIERPSPPVALVGSSNTVLTAALAQSLRTARGPNPAGGPILLVPWASAVLVERAEPEAGPVTLLDIDPGRIFRFCPNNQSEADLVVRALADHDHGTTLERAFVVEDRHDPYSVDLADCFHRAIERIAPEAEVVDHPETLGFSGMFDSTDLPSSSEDTLAETIWRQAEATKPGRSLWVVLPLQDRPAKRMLLALRRHARPLTAHSGSGPLRVVCGDGLSLQSLTELAGKPPFPVWCATFDTPAKRVSEDHAAETAHVLIPAEIILAVVRALDRPEDRPATSDGLREALRALKVPAGRPGGLDRSIAFTPTGERQGDDIGQVLLIRPGATAIFEVKRDGSGRWEKPVAIWPRPEAGASEGRP